MKPVSIALFAVISGISALFAFPGYLILADRALGLGIMQLLSLYPIGLTLILAPCALIPILVFTSFKRRNTEGTRMPTPVKAIIPLCAFTLTLILYWDAIPPNSVSLFIFETVMRLNFFFLSTILLTSLFYLLKGNTATPKQDKIRRIKL